MIDPYQNFVHSLVKPGEQILENINPEQLDLIHMIMGVCGEAGELLDAIKKHVIYNKPLDVANVVEELGDIEFYLQGIRNNLGLSREFIIEQNISKLSKRYSDGAYTDKDAQARADKQNGE